MDERIRKTRTHVAAALRQSPAKAERSFAAAIASVGRALPPHRYTQEELIAALRPIFSAKNGNLDRLERLQRTLKVGARHLALPREQYAELRTFRERNDAFIRVATEIGEAAFRDALEAARIGPQEVDALFFATVTGVATPTIDARLVNRLGLRPDIKRVPIFGLGCVAGAAGLARVADYLRGFPEEVAVLLSVELCSLTLQREDLSVANLVASGLFGDGAAAVVAFGAKRARKTRPRVIATRSRFYPDTERVMGWEVGESGFKIVLSASVPEVVRKNIGADVELFLAEHGLERRDIRSWVCHPGGPKVLEAFQAALGLSESDLAITWRSLSELGNMSSTSVLFVLADAMEPALRPPEGAPGLMIAMGPGFCSEMVLFEW
jgi:alkylresorcinol/alkylpyrone synthase